jgi:hydrogenase maturation protein HypF
VVAVKGLGGYHLAADAASEPAVAALRARKHREDKPFAVMVADLDGARALCWSTRPRRPCWPARGGRSCCCARRPSERASPPVAPQNRSLG